MTPDDKKDFFAATRWTVILRTGAENKKTADSALEELCLIYWFPLYAYVRGRGFSREDAEDLTQGFFEKLLRTRNFSYLSSEQGRFRAFLLASLKNYLANEFDRANRVKRGKGKLHLSLDWEYATKRFEMRDESSSNPDELYDREWALALLQRVLERLREEWRQKGKNELFDIMKDFLSFSQKDSRYSEASRQLGISEGNLRITAHRLRKRYRALLKEEISLTLSEPEMVDDELQALMQAFTR